MLEARALPDATITHARGTARFGIALPLACGACLCAGAAYVAAVDPSDGGGFTACPIRAATGRWCPGCGLTRATHHLLRGDVLQALAFNLLVPAVLVGLGLLWWAWARVAAGFDPPRWVNSISVPMAVAAGSLLVVFTVVRNLPAAGWLRGGS